MIQTILFSPFILIRNILLIILSLIALIILLIYLVLTSSVILGLIADIFLSTYNITFSSIQANIFSGISVDNLAIKDKIVSKNLKIEWDLSQFKDIKNIKIITIKRLDIDNLNKDNMIELISAFDSNNTEDSNSTFDVEILLKSSHISVDKFIESNITINNIYLSLENLSFYKNKLYIPSINISSKLIIKDILLDIKSSKHTILYDINNSFIDVNSTLNIDTNYSKDIEIKNIFRMDKDIYYSGYIKSNKIILDKNLTKYIKYIESPNIVYEGYKDNIDINLSTNYIDSNISIYQYKNINLDVEFNRDIYLNEFIKNLPKDINKTKILPRVKLFYNKDKNKGNGKVNIFSSLLNIDANIKYDKTINIKADLEIPKNSKLKNIDKNIVWKNLSNISLDTDIDINNSVIDSKISSKYLKIKGFYNYKDTSLYSKINLDNFNIDIRGKTDNNLIINKKANIKKLLKSLSRVYTLEKKLKIDGILNIKAKIIKLKDINLTISSNKILYNNSKKDKIILKDIYLSLSKVGTEINLKRYNVNYNDFYIFATKPSYITLYNDRLITHTIIVNDEAKIFLDYNLTTKKGEMSLDTTSFNVERKFIKTNIQTTIKGTIDNNTTEIKGDIYILNGDIFYNLDRKRFSSSKDIIIVQHQKKKGINFFKDFVFMDVNVKTKKSIIYNKKNINLKIDTDLKIFKPLKGDISILGEIKIKENGFYIIKNKKFRFKNSKMYFIGETSNTILDLKLEYKNANYIIKISVRGDVSNPIITFSSNSNLTQAEILSVILFDSSTGGDSTDTTELIKMIGGALAKSLLANIGIKLDYLVFGANNRVEIGKEIVKGLTIIYVNDEVSSIKLQYKHNSFTTTTIKVNNQSQSADIVFKKRFDKF